jgi:hypothetical protein
MLLPFASITRLGAGSVSQANMRLSLASGWSFVDFNIANVLADCAGKNYLLIVKDSTGKKIDGFINGIGGGEGGDEVLTGWTNGNYHAFASSGKDIGYAVKDTAGTKYAYSNGGISSLNRLYKLAATIALVSGELPTLVTAAGGSDLGGGLTAFQVANGVNTKYFTQTNGAYHHLFVFSYNNAYFGGVFSVKYIVNPAATGVWMKSTKGGGDDSWRTIESGFNPNDPGGYTYEIYRV